MHRKPVLLLDHDGFYADLVRWLRDLVPAGFAGTEAIADLVVVDTVPGALDEIESRLDGTVP
jgi:predicted Rossmann-fold nucleotide-binding protein